MVEYMDTISIIYGNVQINQIQTNQVVSFNKNVINICKHNNNKYTTKLNNQKIVSGCGKMTNTFSVNVPVDISYDNDLDIYEIIGFLDTLDNQMFIVETNTELKVLYTKQKLCKYILKKIYVV